MSAELASRLGAPVVGTYHVRGLGGYTTQVVRAGPLRVGNATYPEAYYAVFNDLRRYGYDVVLGADALRRDGRRDRRALAYDDGWAVLGHAVASSHRSRSKTSCRLPTSISAVVAA